MINDELQIYHGKDFKVSDYIIIHTPTLGEIEEYGESAYYSMIHNLVATPQNMKWQLWDSGIDYTEIAPYELFYKLIYSVFSKEETRIIFGDLDLQKFKPMKDEKGNILLYQSIPKKEYSLWERIKNKFKRKSEDENSEENGIIIDEFTYELIADRLRKMHFLEKDEKIPANNFTKEIFIEDDREEYERNKNKEYHSQLLPLVSTMVNSEGFKYNATQVWDVKINVFMDSVKRIPHIKNADLLLSSGYSGFGGVDLKQINKKQIDWFGELQ